MFRVSAGKIHIFCSDVYVCEHVVYMSAILPPENHARIRDPFLTVCVREIRLLRGRVEI